MKNNTIYNGKTRDELIEETLDIDYSSYSTDELIAEIGEWKYIDQSDDQIIERYRDLTE